MKKTFLRALLINAVVQFAITRHRAGQAIEEGAAEMMWVRYPAVVLMNALSWTLLLAIAGRALRVFRAG